MRHPPARLFSPVQRAATTKETFFFFRIICDPARLAAMVVCFSLYRWFLLFSYSHILSKSCFQMHSWAFSFPTYCILCSAFWLPSLFLQLFIPVPFGSGPPGTRSETLTAAEYWVNLALAGSVEFRALGYILVCDIMPWGPWHHCIARVAERNVLSLLHLLSSTSQHVR